MHQARSQELRNDTPRTEQASLEIAYNNNLRKQAEQRGDTASARAYKKNAELIESREAYLQKFDREHGYK